MTPVTCLRLPSVFCAVRSDHVYAVRPDQSLPADDRRQTHPDPTQRARLPGQHTGRRCHWGAEGDAPPVTDARAVGGGGGGGSGSVSPLGRGHQVLGRGHQVLRSEQTARTTPERSGQDRRKWRMEYHLPWAPSYAQNQPGDWINPVWTGYCRLTLVLSGSTGDCPGPSGVTVW